MNTLLLFEGGHSTLIKGRAPEDIAETLRSWGSADIIQIRHGAPDAPPGAETDGKVFVRVGSVVGVTSSRVNTRK